MGSSSVFRKVQTVEFTEFQIFKGATWRPREIVVVKVPIGVKVLQLEPQFELFAKKTWEVSSPVTGERLFTVPMKKEESVFELLSRILANHDSECEDKHARLQVLFGSKTITEAYWTTALHTYLKLQRVHMEKEAAAQVPVQAGPQQSSEKSPGESSENTEKSPGKSPEKSPKKSQQKKKEKKPVKKVAKKPQKAGAARRPAKK